MSDDERKGQWSRHTSELVEEDVSGRSTARAIKSDHVGIRGAYERSRVKAQQEMHRVFFPWSISYKSWWGFTVFAAIFTVFFETYMIAFQPAGLKPFDQSAPVLSFLLTGIFVVDILINFNLAFYNENDEIIQDRKLIAKHYLRYMFWVDFVGVFPFELVVLAMAGELGDDSRTAQYISLLRLFRLVRLHRVVLLFDNLQYSTKISFMTLTLTRNFSFALVWTHFAACVMFFISRQYGFSEDETWIGGSIADLSGFERYCTALYWSIVTFTTVGYGDFSPVNSGEQIWGMIYMLINIIFQSWVIGSITLLIVKHDEDTGAYRDALTTLDQYCSVHAFDGKFQKRLKTQVKLDFTNRVIADEEVLRNFPSAVRRRVVRRLYLPSLRQTSLMQSVRQQFVDAFLSTCKVELFSPGEEILERGSVSSDLYLLIEGTVKLLPFGGRGVSASEHGGSAYYTSVADSELGNQLSQTTKVLSSGEFINEIGFFTESPQIEAVQTITVCKTLTISRSAYKQIADDNPGSAGKILKNLLAKVEKTVREVGSIREPNLPVPLNALGTGAIYDPTDTSVNDLAHDDEVRDAVASIQAETAVIAVRELVRMHINKQKDDNTTRFLFAASRDDTATIRLMCDQGFDADSADYDNRTALMVAGMKGNTEAVKTLLEYQANPNLTDVHGSSALYDATKNGHESTMEELLKHGADLCMNESQAASTLCQMVFDSDIVMLRRLLHAKIKVDASDYDKRAAVHIAAAEGNVAALRVLVEFGADLALKDRWNNTVEDEAKSANAGPVLDYLKTMKEGTTEGSTPVVDEPTDSVPTETQV